MQRLLLILILAGCQGSADDSGSGGAGDTDRAPWVDYPVSQGFEFDGGWYAVPETATACQTASMVYRFSGAGPRDAGGPEGTAHIYFLLQPEQGMYDLQAYSPGTQPHPDKAGLGVIDERDNSFWFSDGQSGRVDVAPIGGVAIDVVWHDATLQSTTGEAATSSAGWVRCPF